MKWCTLSCRYYHQYVRRGLRARAALPRDVVIISVEIFSRFFFFRFRFKIDSRRREHYSRDIFASPVATRRKGRRGANYGFDGTITRTRRDAVMKYARIESKRTGGGVGGGRPSRFFREFVKDLLGKYTTYRRSRPYAIVITMYTCPRARTQGVPRWLARSPAR